MGPVTDLFKQVDEEDESHEDNGSGVSETDILNRFKESDERKRSEEQMKEIELIIAKMFVSLISAEKSEYEVLEKDNPLTGGKIMIVKLTGTGRMYMQEFAPELLISIFNKQEDADFFSYLRSILDDKFEPKTAKTTPLIEFKSIFKTAYKTT